jgi:hypothetical protein
VVTEGVNAGGNGRDTAAQGAQRKADRTASVKAAREKKRAMFLEKRRKQTAPHVVGVLALSAVRSCGCTTSPAFSAILDCVRSLESFSR